MPDKAFFIRTLVTVNAGLRALTGAALLVMRLFPVPA
jgi:hypothetical protein